MCLTGGSSPRQLYALLAGDAYRSKIPWDRVHWFIGDERFVPPSDPLNNMGVARRFFWIMRARRQHASDPDRAGRSRCGARSATRAS